MTCCLVLLAGCDEFEDGSAKGESKAKPVVSEVDRGPVKLTVTADRDLSAARLVVCAGPWSERFLPELPLEVRRKVLLWLRAEPRAYSPADGTPVFGFEDSGRFFYGFPALEPGVVKVALHTGGTRVCAADRPQRNLEAADVDEIKALCRAHLPKVEPVVLRHAVCMYTMTPDEHFVVDRDDNVAFAAGLSGHGFKMAPVIGEALADLALDGRTELPIGFLSAARFAH